MKRLTALARVVPVPLVMLAALVPLVTGAGGCADEPAEPAETAEPTDRAALADSTLRPAWTETGSMSVARHSLTATRLADGTVLVTGGRKIGAFDTGDVDFRTAEIYRPSLKSFGAAGSMVVQRVGHVAVTMANKNVIVIGGAGGLSATTSEVFAVATGKWSATPATLAHGRVGAAAVALLDGGVLVTGGDSDPPYTSAEIYDPGAGTWTGAAAMLVRRRGHTATRLTSGRVLVAGGNSTGTAATHLASAEIYYPASDTWLVAPSMKRKRSGHAATLLADGRVLVTGGSTGTDIQATAEIYDPVTSTWTAAPAMASARVLHTATRLDNGAVMVAGGVDTTSSVLRAVELFDAQSNQWIAVGPMAHGRLAHAAAPLEGGGMLVTGGENQSSAEIYTPGALGDACLVGVECGSGHCADGVCCDSDCAGTCHTCAEASSRGTCVQAQAGTDPRAECGGGAPCDDACGPSGACEDRVGQVCATPLCDGNGSATVPATCAVRGGACPSSVVACAPFLCGARDGSEGCFTRCTSVDDCAPGYACDGDGQCVTPPDAADRDPLSCAAAASSRGSGGSGGSGAAWAALMTALAWMTRAARKKGRRA